MIRFELWMHRETGDCFAVRLRNARVAGATGPLAAAAMVRRQEIAATDYDDVVVTARLESQRALFTVVDAWADTPLVDRNPDAVACIRWVRDEM